MINWIFFPKSKRPPSIALDVVSIFKNTSRRIDSRTYDLSSNRVLELLSEQLQKVGFKVEKGRRKEDRIDVPVLFGYGGRIEKAFKADAHNAEEGVVLEVEAGRGVLNYQFLKDLFQACMMADIRYAFIAVRNKYKNRDDFESVVTFLDTLYTSNRLQLPLEGVLIIGY